MLKSDPDPIDVWICFFWSPGSDSGTIYINPDPKPWFYVPFYITLNFRLPTNAFLHLNVKAIPFENGFQSMEREMFLTEKTFSLKVFYDLHNFLALSDRERE